MKKYTLLVKINQGKHIDDMFENEYLHFKPLKYFRDPKKDLTGRLDSRELNISNIPFTNLTLKLGHKKIEMHKVLKDFNGQFNEYLSDPKTSCCSLHWMELNFGEINSNFNERLLEMGDKALLIFNGSKFVEILDKSIEKLGYKYKRRRVEYYSPKSFNGKLTLHHKDEFYKYQNEYRILISPTTDEPINIFVPGLKEISTVVNSSDIKNLKLGMY